MRRHDLSVYLRELAAVCIEASADARLLPLLIMLLMIAPATILQMARAGRQRRIAA